MIILPNSWSQDTKTDPVNVIVCNDHLHSLVLLRISIVEDLKLEVNEEALLVAIYFFNRMKPNKLWSKIFKTFDFRSPLFYFILQTV